ncbi:hypothetical protein [Pseudomonas sp. MYb185]|uniref:hypothetical protein n=1 Tax=Pseudomonas sp. MYb185 TaxID=1848729 RepID=UPI000CFC7DC7|nr:hypothetical protein [Pseudomonas sp. MYb185]PRB80977.1 hypothetical protein CQ007_11615 [Pseudomonas sp. MYb185]
MPDSDPRPRYRVSADRSSARRRVRYVESSHPDDGSCTLCQLDELAQDEAQSAALTDRTKLPAPSSP